MDAATLTIDLDKRRCCYCSPSKSRCSTDTCICFKSGRQCDRDCESSNWTGDCLNKSIVHCRCTKVYNPSSSSAAQSSRSLTSSSTRKTELNNADYLFCNHDSDCPCYRFNESCSYQCQCRGECSNVLGRHETHKNIIDYLRFPKLDRPVCGCSCSGRGGCRKFKKCLCLQSLAYCGLGCKCRRECSNTKTRFELSKHARNAMFDPEQCPSGSTAVLQIVGLNYGFQLEFTTPNVQVIHAEEILCRVLTRALSMYAIPIQHLLVYTPNSPCFHQDCQPRCEIVDQCTDGKSCSTALSILYRQLKKLTRNTHMEMTVRFLNPYTYRGDLYTKRSILAMMEHGIRVEPITVKEWTDLMRDSTYKNTKKVRSISMDRLFFHNHNNQQPTSSEDQQQQPIRNNLSTYQNLWHVADMDRYVRSAQHYINESRRTLGYSECYWTSSFHDLLRMTVLTCASASEKLTHIAVHMSPPLREAGYGSTRGSSFEIGSSDVASNVHAKRQNQLKRQSRLSINESPSAKPKNQIMANSIVRPGHHHNQLENLANAAAQTMIVTGSMNPATNPSNSTVLTLTLAKNDNDPHYSMAKLNPPSSQIVLPNNNISSRTPSNASFTTEHPFNTTSHGILAGPVSNFAPLGLVQSSASFTVGVHGIQANTIDRSIDPIESLAPDTVPKFPTPPPPVTPPKSGASSSHHRIRSQSGPSSFKNSKFRIVDESIDMFSRSVNELSMDEDNCLIDTPSTSHPSVDPNLHLSHESHEEEPNRSRSLPRGQHTLDSIDSRNRLITADDRFSSLAPSTSTSQHQAGAISLHAPAAVVAEKILQNLSGRNMMHGEQQEIKNELSAAIDSIQRQLNALMLYLDQKMAGESV